MLLLFRVQTFRCVHLLPTKTSLTGKHALGKNFLLELKNIGKDKSLRTSLCRTLIQIFLAVRAWLTQKVFQRLTLTLLASSVLVKKVRHVAQFFSSVNRLLLA